MIDEGMDDYGDEEYYGEEDVKQYEYNEDGYGVDDFNDF